jgi:hypothetical protein
MSGDYTRFTFKHKKNYSEVRQQQGRVSLDADWNEAEAIDDRRWRSETLDILDHYVVPATTPDAFLISPTGMGTFDIGLGRAYLDGLQVENHGGDPQRFDRILAERTGTTALSYDGQPWLPSPPPLTLPASGRSDLVYLHAWQREVTALEDPELLEIALGGPDTTTRLQTVWQVQVLEDVGDVHCPDPLDAWDALIRPSAGRLTTSVVAPTDEGPCVLSPSGGYRGLENRLYRVEIHTPGAVGVAKFKWSRDNASVRAAVEAISALRDQITVRELGRDEVLRFQVGDWVEVLDDHVELRIQAGENLTGHTAQVTAIDEANRILTIAPDIPASLGLDATLPERHTRVRRWDQSVGVDVDGLLDTAAGPLELEDGVQVEFAIDPDDPTGEFKRGDYWVFAARTADGSGEVLSEAPPRGVHHHYCRLAVVNWGATPEATHVHDCRTIWPPARCCTITVRPGEDIQAAIDRVPPDGGCVCLLPGLHLIHEPLLIDGRQNLVLKGVGPASKLVYESLDPQVQHQAMLYLVGGSRDIRVAELLMYAESLPRLVVADEQAEALHLESCHLINAFAGGGDLLPDCLLLGHCCDVHVSESRLLGVRDLAQASAAELAAVDTDLSALRPAPVETGEGGEFPGAAEQPAPEPRDIAPVEHLRVRDNQLYFTEAGILLLDLLEGRIGGNRLQAVATEVLTGFQRPVGGPAGTEEFVAVPDATSFHGWLDDLLAELPPCAAEPAPEGEGEGTQPAETSSDASSGRGVWMGLARELAIRDNAIAARWGIQITQGRSLRIQGNRLQVTGDGIRLGFVFDAAVGRNRVRVVEPDSGLEEPAPTDLNKLWSARFDSGTSAIGLRFTRGLRICRNQIHAHTGIRTSLEPDPPVPIAELPRQSVLRVLGIERLWRVLVEIFWFLYQIVLQVSAGGTAPPEAGAREEFEHRLFQRFLGLLPRRYIGYFVGKAEISDNRMQVTRYGVRLYRILSVGGLRVLRNRISGQRWAGILIHPWYSVGRVDDYAKWLRCTLEWLLSVLALLRDALAQFLGGGTSGAAPAAGVTGWVAQGISWILVLCARWCGGGAGEGEGEEETPPSPAEGLKDALDEFLDHLDPTWLDDLVNQAYVIDGNVLAGSGDGIVTGLDGTRISHNQVTIWPRSPVPFETVVFGLLFRRYFAGTDTDVNYFTSEAQALADSAEEADRDALYLSVSLAIAAGWGVEYFNQPTFRALLRAFLSAWGTQVNANSPLAPAIQSMLAGLTEGSLDPTAVGQAWLRLLILMVWELRGYGIVMLGADMDCRNNRVEARTGCGSNLWRGGSAVGTDTDVPGAEAAPAAGTPGVTPAATTTVYRPRIPFTSPGMGGIWQNSNFLSWTIDWLRLILGGLDNLDTYDLVVAMLAFLSLYLSRGRNQRVCENQVETALVHGIRTLNLYGSDETEVMDNFVRDASRHGIYHRTASMVELNSPVTYKGHRNTVLRAPKAALFRRLGTLPLDFSSLIRVENGDEKGVHQEGGYGTVLLSMNHCDGGGFPNEESAAVYLETTVAAVTGNHVLSDAQYAFDILAREGLYTDNIRDGELRPSPLDIAQGPDVTI